MREVELCGPRVFTVSALFYSLSFRWLNCLSVNGVLRGVGQASKKGHARDRAAEQALLNMNIAIGG